jgi:hypothetical protein
MPICNKGISVKQTSASTSGNVRFFDKDNSNYIDLHIEGEAVSSNINVYLPNSVNNTVLVGRNTTDTLTNKTLKLPKIFDTSDNHNYIFGVNELTADRTITLPLLGGNDIFVFESHSQTLTNKTINSSSATLTALTVNGSLTANSTTLDLSNIQKGDILYADSDNSVKRLPKGNEYEILTMVGGTPQWLQLRSHTHDLLATTSFVLASSYTITSLPYTFTGNNIDDGYDSGYFTAVSWANKTILIDFNITLSNSGYAKREGYWWLREEGSGWCGGLWVHRLAGTQYLNLGIQCKHNTLVKTPALSQQILYNIKFTFEVDSSGRIGQAKSYVNNIFADSSYPYWVTSGNYVPDFSSSLKKQIVLGTGGDGEDYLHNNTKVTLNSISYIT